MTDGSANPLDEPDDRPDDGPLDADERGSLAQSRTFYLEIVTQQDQLRRVPLHTELLIGRSPKRCQVVLPDNRVSRVHLRVQRDPDRGVTVTDLYTANGTTFDGRPLEPGVPITWLINQTALIGETRITLRYGTTGPLVE
ncbi:MAG: FHA domain-containing protein [Anaerolineae bacterium]|nr:FHA domain-containing protein [Anaerolineae bacterium]